MVAVIWVLMLIWLPMIYSTLRSILEVLKDVRDMLKKGGAE